MPPVLSLPKGSNPVLENIQRNVNEASSKNTQQPDCGWVGKGINDLYFITVQAKPVPGAAPVGDFVINLPKAFRKFFIVSCTNSANNNSKYLHLSPIGKHYPTGSPGITPDGSEQWFNMNQVTGANQTQGANIIKFKEPVQQIYLDFGFETGGGTPYQFTICCTDEGVSFPEFPLDYSQLL